MSDTIKHECGLALIRLLKPLSYYIKKYETPLYGLNKLYLLMEKQHNRGQDGAGVGVVNLDMDPGDEYLFRKRSIDPNPISDIFSYIHSFFRDAFKAHPQFYRDEEWLKKNVPFSGELLLGHLRYGTHGKNNKQACHPFIRQNNWKSRNLMIAGNFNMTNNDKLFNLLLDLGQYPRSHSDTVTVLEKIGHFLDEENERLYKEFKEQGYSKREITDLIIKNIDLTAILREAAEDFDGGYAMAGLIGHGDAFILRDPNGIRPAYYYYDDEVVVVASERPAIKTAFNLPFTQLKEISPGHALIIKKSGHVSEEKILEPKEKLSCSFERIYFSRGSDEEIYNERKKLGELLAEKVLKEVNYEMENTVFSYIPNTAEIAFLGLIKGVEKYFDKLKKDQILKNPQMADGELTHLLAQKPRVEKIAIKDVKMRTFIADDEHRDDMVTHVYDTTYGVINPGKDNLVVLDDSIVRGTTLNKSIIKILGRLKPKKILIISSAPQIRYPDCYGIDMSKMSEFIAFRAAIELLNENDLSHIINEVYLQCKEQMENDPADYCNYVKQIYAPFSANQISEKISELVKPANIDFEVKVVYQSIENLHKACPNNKGDWYFTGDFPTPGGKKVICKAFMNYFEGKNERSY